MASALAFCSSFAASSGGSSPSISNNRVTQPASPVRLFGSKSEAKDDLASAVGEVDSETKETKTRTGTWNPFSLLVLKLGFTEPAWTSPYNYSKNRGTYTCASCGSALFPSSAKYDSGSGWPSFWKTSGEDRVEIRREWDGRLEARCKKCGKCARPRIVRVSLACCHAARLTTELTRITTELTRIIKTFQAGI